MRVRDLMEILRDLDPDMEVEIVRSFRPEERYREPLEPRDVDVTDNVLTFRP
jgi:hypothetical protein